MKKDKQTQITHILYSFRRCPYAMRARLALLSAQIPVILREVSLKNKPLELLAISEKATVPCLQTSEKVIPESLEIMYWALSQNDPQNLLNMPTVGYDLIEYNDGPFKSSLDRTKYRSRYEDVRLEVELTIAKGFLDQLNSLLNSEFLCGDKMSLADLALLPFIRQYAFIDKIWFDKQEWNNVNRWLTSFLISNNFAKIQKKFPIWQSDDRPVIFSA